MKGFLILVFWVSIFLIIAVPTTVVARGLLENVIQMAGNSHAEASYNLLSIYLLGFVFFGLPMAIVSARFYLWGTDFPKLKWYKPLMILRDILHPGSFVVSASEAGSQAHVNYRGDYNSLIRFIINEYNPKKIQVIIYVFISASLWPLRAMLSGLFLSYALIIILVSVVLGTIYYLILCIAFLIRLPFRLFAPTPKNQSQSCDSKS